MSFPSAGATLHQCHFCQGCFPTQVALGLHLIDHNRLRAMEAAEALPPAAPAFQPPLPPPPAFHATPAAPPLPPTPPVAPVAAVVSSPTVVAPPLPTFAVPSLLKVEVPPAPTSAPAPPLPTPPAVAPAPPAGMATGVVEHYNKRQFGFIKRSGPGANLYFVLKACNFQSPPPSKGEKVFFTEKTNQKGKVAASVVRTRNAPTATTKPPSVSSSASELPTDASLVAGVVKEYHILGAYGLATTDAGNELHFVLASCDVKRPPPKTGERVMVNETTGKKGPTASIVHRPTVTEEGPPKNKFKPKPKAVSPRAGNKPSKSTKTFAQRIAEQTKSMLEEVPSVFDGGKHPRYVYVDLDNIWVSFAKAEHLVSNYPGAESTRDLLLHLDGLTRRLATGDPGSSVARLVAFYYKTPAAIAHKLKKLSHDGVTWEVRKQETASDTSMQLELLNAKRPCEAHPKTLVLATGDGNIAPNGMCFRSILDLYLRDGWCVEVHAWLATMARSYIEFQREYSSTVVIRPLDDDLCQIVLSRKANKADADLIPGIVTKYEPLGGFGTIAKLDGSGGDLHFSILHCDHIRPQPTIGERVMLAEGVSKKWGPCATSVSRITIEVDSEDATSGERKGSVASNDNELESETKSASLTQGELSAALTRAMDMVLADTTSASSSSDDDWKQPAQPSQEEAAIDPEEYDAMIRVLSIPQSVSNLSPAIALLKRTHPDEAATIQDMDPATQRILLLSIFHDELGIYEPLDLDVDMPADSSQQPVENVENGSPRSHSHSEPESEPSDAMQCELCTDDALSGDIVLVGGCDHVFCSQCLRNYAVDRIEQEDVKPECPLQGCGSVLSDVDLARVLPIEEQKKYYDARMKLAAGSAAATSL